MFRRLLFNFQLCAVGALALAFIPHADGQLTHSRYNPSLATIFNCCNTDTLSINVVLTNDQTVAPVLGPATYTVYVNGTASGIALLNAAGKFANPDPSNPYQQTIVVSGLAGMDGQYQQYPGTFTYAIQVNSTVVKTVTVINWFVADFLYSFLGLPVTVYPHTPMVLNEYVNVTLNGLKPQNRDHPCPRTGCGCCQAAAGKPMTSYSFNSMLAGVSLSDTPVSYNPPHGEPIRFTVSYNQQDTNQPAVFAQSNLGPQWTFNWMTYISAGPITGQLEAVRYLPGGGQERYEDFVMNSLNSFGGYNGRESVSAPHEITSATLYALTIGADPRPDFYQIFYPDGAYEIYNNNAGGNFYLTSRIDPQGNTTTINYAPGTAQITSIVDALGQVTTFSYGLASDPLKITTVTDPFGRFATFTYDAQGRLTSITDPIGIVSSFGYQGSTNNVSSLHSCPRQQIS